MKNTVPFLFSLFLFAGLTGCGGMPKHAQTRANEKPELVIVAAPLGAEVIIDGRHVGVITDDEEQRFAITSGSHRVQIRKDGAELYDYELFIQNSTRREIDLLHPNH